MASGGKSVAVLPMPPAAPPDFVKYRDAVTSPDNMTTPAAAAAEPSSVGEGGGGESSGDQKVSDYLGDYLLLRNPGDYTAWVGLQFFL